MIGSGLHLPETGNERGDPLRSRIRFGRDAVFAVRDRVQVVFDRVAAAVVPCCGPGSYPGPDVKGRCDHCFETDTHIRRAESTGGIGGRNRRVTFPFPARSTVDQNNHTT